MSASISQRSLHRLPALDAVRVIGALAVIGHHVGFATGVNTGTGPWAGFFARLDVGVAVFFVLSGFLLFRPYAHAQATATARPGAGRYLWRRAMRILPAYWVTVVVCLLAMPRDEPVTGADWARHLTLTQIYQHNKLRDGLSQTWSLATEVAFYLVLPLLALALASRRRRAGRPLLILGCAAAITGTWVSLMGLGVLSLGLHTMWLPAYGLWFGSGMALAAIHVSLRNDYAPRWRFLDDLGGAPLACWAAAAAVLAIATTPIAGPRDLAEPTAVEFGLKMLLYATFAVLLVLPIAFGPDTRSKAVFSSGTAHWLGTVSYGLFLWHPFALEWIQVIGGIPDFNGDTLDIFLLTVAGGLLLASISYYVVERPFQRLSHRWPRSPRPPRPSTTESQRPVAAASAAS
ncbi:acyltransferase family protein [Actinoplanes nipponensis]|uniref:acyltransferase family protein n=1 Tax=Actinoplanes nipponensis TaxID=135950 RepID=UPI0019405A0E|nr:acyltransferase [Actinoplanes nipponensis]